MLFKSNILIQPGLGNSGAGHWQSLWVERFGFDRIEQQDWETPIITDWVQVINRHVSKYEPANVILVGHSMACIAIAYWAQQYTIPVKAALLVAPSDTEADTFPAGTTGFKPIELKKLPFPSIVVGSTNDQYITFDRAKLLADSWGSTFVNIGSAGHVNIASGFGEWDQGLSLLKQLDDL